MTDFKYPSGRGRLEELSSIATGVTLSLAVRSSSDAGEGSGGRAPASLE